MRSSRFASWAEAAVLAIAGLAASGCQRDPPPERERDAELSPAYVRTHITDPVLRDMIKEIQKQALEEVGAGKRLLYSRAEVLPPTQTVQPYGVGAYQQEPRLPVILTTGPGWSALKQAEKEEKAVKAFRTISAQLETLKRTPPLRPTLTIQTPQGMELGWINHLDPSGKNLHGGDE